VSAPYIGPDARVFDSAQVSDSARVFDSARVYGSAQVYGSARVFGLARVYGSAVIAGDGLVSKSGDYLTLGPSLVSQRFVTAHRDEKIGVRVNAGCFSGTIDEFEAKAKKTHADNPRQRAQYELFALMFRSHFELLEGA
jgi:hypothetical protein